MVLSEAPYLLIIIVVSAAVLPAEIACLRPRLHEAERICGTREGMARIGRPDHRVRIYCQVLHSVAGHRQQ